MNQILYLALVQKHTSVQLDGRDTTASVMYLYFFHFFFFDPHVCHLKTHVSEYSSEYMYYQNFRVLRGKKKSKKYMYFLKHYFFQLTLPSLQWFPQPSLSQGAGEIEAYTCQ